VTALVSIGSFPSSASPDQLRLPRPTRGGAASLDGVAAESLDSPRKLGGFVPSAIAEREPGDAESRSVLMQTPTTRPVWVNGTLPGTMAGKRPAVRPTGSI